MLNFLARTFIGLIVVVLLIAAAGYFLLQDPNRFKPEIEAFIAERTGVTVDLGTDLSWQLFPPLALSGRDIQAEYEGNRYQLGAMKLKLDLLSVVRNRDINQWEVVALTLNDLHIDQPGSATRIDSFTLEKFRPATPSPFTATLTQQTGDQPARPLTLHGLVAIDPDTRQASLTDTKFETTEASGVCDLDATYTEGTQPADPPDAIIPVSIWRSVDWSGLCTLDRLTLSEEDFRDVAVTLNNSGGASTTDIRLPDFFGGTAGANIAIDASGSPVLWRIEPDLARADSQALMAWLDRRLKWIAPLAYSGAITMQGNTREELVSSVKGRTTFDGGQGRIDIAQIKAPLLSLAKLLRDPDRIAAWPDMWDYQRLIGDWTIDGTRHQMDFALDNLTAALNGTYDPLTDALDMNAEVQFEDMPDMHSFDVNPILVGLAIPLTCNGTLETPKCGVNPEAARQLVATALTSGEGTEVRQKIDRAIEEQVPEQYREAARGLLDMLGESLKKQQPAQN